MANEDVSPEDFIKEIRIEMHKMLQKIMAARSVDSFQDCGRPISIAYTKLEEARMWMGKCMESLGSELPEQFANKGN